MAVVRSTLLLALGLTSACGGSTAVANPSSFSLVAAQFPAQGYGGAYRGGMATGDTQAGAAFARWDIVQDPQHQLMTDAIVRGSKVWG